MHQAMAEQQMALSATLQSSLADFAEARAAAEEDRTQLQQAMMIVSGQLQQNLLQERNARVNFHVAFFSSLTTLQTATVLTESVPDLPNTAAIAEALVILAKRRRKRAGGAVDDDDAMDDDEIDADNGEDDEDEGEEDEGDGEEEEEEDDMDEDE